MHLCRQRTVNLVLRIAFEGDWPACIAREFRWFVLSRVSVLEIEAQAEEVQSCEAVTDDYKNVHSPPLFFRLSPATAALLTNFETTDRSSPNNVGPTRRNPGAPYTSATKSLVAPDPMSKAARRIAFILCFSVNCFIGFEKPRLKRLKQLKEK